MWKQRILKLRVSIGFLPAETLNILVFLLLSLMYIPGYLDENIVAHWAKTQTAGLESQVGG